MTVAMMMAGRSHGGAAAHPAEPRSKCWHHRSREITSAHPQSRRCADTTAVAAMHRPGRGAEPALHNSTRYVVTNVSASVTNRAVTMSNVDADSGIILDVDGRWSNSPM